MDTELSTRLDKIEKQIFSKKKDFWEKLPLFTPILIPVTIALVGWYFTNQHNKNQLEVQQINNENQLQVALINSNVGQSELIKDFMQHLTSKDSAVKNIAIEAILYAAPTPGKRIVEIIANSGDAKTREVANDALAGKRTDLVSNLFSTQKEIRIIAANEIMSSWTGDDRMLSAIIARADNCLQNKDSSPDCDNGVFNSIVVLLSFSKQLLSAHKEEIKGLINKIPGTSQLTLTQGKELRKKIEE
jgi:hypothetical protein